MPIVLFAASFGDVRAKTPLGSLRAAGSLGRTHVQNNSDTVCRSCVDTRAFCLYEIQLNGVERVMYTNSL